ncbi:MAG: hypothetical protein K8E24_004480 [Methanobacterium paludis]|nr:hypothetical protein [Methanobacterium paludis]
MSIAKNFAIHGVWGVTEYGFTSSSSSLLWTLIISVIYYLTGVNNLIPFIVNIILGSLTICIVYYILKSLKIRPIYTLIVLLGVIFFAPIPYLIFIGMEHILQIILVTSYLYLAVQILTNSNSKPLNDYLLLILTVPLAMVRYESLFLIVIVAFLFILKRRFKYAFLIVGFAVLPLAIYGLISVLNGWSFLPNSLIIKSSVIKSSINTISNTAPDLTKSYSNYIPKTITSLITYSMAIISAILLLTLATFRFKKSKTIWEVPTLWLVITGTLMFIQLIFVNNDWMLRYTAYLVVLGLIAITLGVSDYIPEKLYFKFNKKSMTKYLGITLLIILLLSPFAIKMYDLAITPQATNNIYEQQYQMALFLKEYYPNESVAANDIGLINYDTNIKCLDLVGLSSNDIAQAHENDTFDASEVYKLANQHDVKIAIIYDEWWTGDVPSSWIKVGEWTTPHNVILGGSTVSFYATSPQYENELIQNLKSFSPKLPEDIEQNGLYTNS